ncbi:hypothetical protein C8P66_10768 [Humitalea rosea]|uniref:DUF2059 domain-containing protein n=1 Tax=Humitalea rosea TaxID=990373 RepID=A0A2W7J5K6_9PROT|nr:hypothetical protein [Humitalea rosea]PZW47030.1 hypothetical protein C8P66_10768 [Humitalea rosea]
MRGALALVLLLAGPALADPIMAAAGIEMLLPQLARPAPFPRSLALAGRMAGEDAEIQAVLGRLGDLAAVGVPNRRMLAATLPAALDAAVAAEVGVEGGLGLFLARVMRLGAGVSGGLDSPALIAAVVAQAHMEAGGLAPAAAALAGLPPEPTLDAWREAARARLRLEAEAALLADLAMRRLVP